MSLLAEAKLIARAIGRAGLSIYDPIAIGDPKFWLTMPALQALLANRLVGISVFGMANRTRSKFVNQEICRALGYPVPKSFRRVQPRFSGQQFDKYVQKSNNLQIANEELVPARRYVLLRVGEDDCISRVKVVTGDVLAPLDTTGTLTRKYQARCRVSPDALELVTPVGTDRLTTLVSSTAEISAKSPVSDPRPALLLSIASLFARLSTLVGARFSNAGHDQERLRGAALHRLACAAIGKRGLRAAGYAACAMSRSVAGRQFQGMSSSQRLAGQSSAILAMTSVM